MAVVRHQVRHHDGQVGHAVRARGPGRAPDPGHVEDDDSNLRVEHVDEAVQGFQSRTYSVEQDERRPRFGARPHGGSELRTLHVDHLDAHGWGRGRFGFSWLVMTRTPSADISSGPLTSLPSAVTTGACMRDLFPFLRRVRVGPSFDGTMWCNSPGRLELTVRPVRDNANHSDLQ